MLKEDRISVVKMYLPQFPQPTKILFAPLEWQEYHDKL